MKKVTMNLLIAALMLSVFSCNNPLNKKYSEQNLEQDMKEIVVSKNADSTDLKYIAMYLVRAKMLGEKLDGKTYSDILVNAKELRKEKEKEDAAAKILAEKTAKEEKEKRELFAKVLTVALYDKGFDNSDWQKYLVYHIAFENKSNKDIRAIKGTIQINDLFDTEIKSIDLVEDSGIPSGKTVKKTYTTNYNQFEDSDKRLNSKNIKDLKTIWKPVKIIFSDGSTLE